jgi:transketolase
MGADVSDTGSARHWGDLAAQLSVDSIRATTEAGSGHPTSSMSAAHLVAVLFSSYLRYDASDPKSLANDRFVLSKGHASPLLYAALKAIGAIDDSQLLSFRKLDSPLQGHPAPVEGMPWVEVATGSLGQGLPVGLGMALAIRGDGLLGRVWVLMGDSEVMEGSVWEAMAAASHHRAANLVAIIDMNGLGQRGPTMLGWDSGAYARRASAFGWRAIEVDGHDVAAIDDAYREASDGRGPTLIVARTEKGHGVSFLAGRQGWHGKALAPEDAERAVAELGGVRSLVVGPPRPAPVAKAASTEPARAYRRPQYGDAIATRQAFGEALAALAYVRPELVVLDAEVANSTHADEFEKAAPTRFFEMYIGEQNMVGAAVGMQALGKAAFAATFGAFLTRAYDFIRMAAVSRADLRLCGSHAGVSIGEDGPSQMALEDLAIMRAINGSTVLYPADGNATVRLVEAMADRTGISYLRTTREKTPRLYGLDEDFEVGGSKTLRAGDRDRGVLVGAGVTLFEALKAADALEAEGIPMRVIDAYSIKPVDARTIRAALADTGLMVVVEDHWAEGGLGDAVLDALADEGADIPGRVVKLAVSAMPGSGSAEQLRERAGISATAIADTVRKQLLD